MKKKKRFNSTEEMLSFVKKLRKQTHESLKLLRIENKLYEKLLIKETAELKEAEAKYRSRKK